MMFLDVVVVCLLAVTSTYCWRLNRKMASFRNAKDEMDHVIRSFDSSIRQAYESIAILKKAGTNENISLIRDMKRLQYLANDLAMLVEKGEKIAEGLEQSVVEQPARQKQAALTSVKAEEKPVFTIPPRRASAKAERRAAPEPTAAELAEVKELVDTLARSYVTEQASGVYRPALRPAQPVFQKQPAAMSAPAVAPHQPASPRPEATLGQRKESKARAIEKMLNHLSAQNQQAGATMPSIPPRDLLRQAEPEAAIAPAKAAAAMKPETRRFFDSLRVITPNE